MGFSDSGGRGNGRSIAQKKLQILWPVLDPLPEKKKGGKTGQDKRWSNNQVGARNSNRERVDAIRTQVVDEAERETDKKPKRSRRQRDGETVIEKDRKHESKKKR